MASLILGQITEESVLQLTLRLNVYLAQAEGRRLCFDRLLWLLFVEAPQEPAVMASSLDGTGEVMKKSAQPLAS